MLSKQGHVHKLDELLFALFRRKYSSAEEEQDTEPITEINFQYRNIRY